MARALTTLLPRHRRSGKEEVPQLGGPLAAGERSPQRHLTLASTIFGLGASIFRPEATLTT